MAGAEIGVSAGGATIDDRADEACDAIEEASDASDEADERAADELEVAVLTVVVVPLLKIQMRPIITITATMMMIQVLRFIAVAFCWKSRLVLRR